MNRFDCTPHLEQMGVELPQHNTKGVAVAAQDRRKFRGCETDPSANLASDKFVAWLHVD